MVRKQPSRLNAGNISKGNLPKGMRPANRMEEDEIEVVDEKEIDRNLLSLKQPMIFLAAALGIGILISYYGVGLLKPAVDQMVATAEEIVEDSN